MGIVGFREFSVSWPFESGLFATDILLAQHAFQREALGRKRSVELDDGFRTDVISPEDLLIYKLIAWRRKDRLGIERLLAVQRDLDWAYARTWTERFGVTDRLRESMKEAGIPETGDPPGPGR